MGKRGPKAWAPTEDQTKLIEQMGAVGISVEQIAAVVGVSADTLERRCGELVVMARTKANSRMGGKLYQTGMNGNVTAMIFWLKTQAHWKEPTQAIELSIPGAITVNIIKK